MPRSPCSLRTAAAGALLCAAMLLCGDLARAQSEFEALAPAKAIATSPARPEEVRAVTSSQPHELAASVLAREQCENLAGPGEVCEVVRLNEQHITTGDAIRGRVPQRPHPLFLWRYRQAGNVVYLAGSIHILKPTLYPLPRQVEEAFRQSDTLVLEVDVSTVTPQALAQRTMAYALLPGGQTLESLLPSPLYQALERHLADFGMTPAMMSRAKPAMVMNQVVVSRLLTLGYMPDSGMEDYFLAQRGSRRVMALEALEDQLELLFEQPLETQVQLLEETLEVEDGIEPLLADMLVAWLSGDDDAFLRLFKAQSGDSELSRAFTRELLDERNENMAAGIKEFLAGREGRKRTYFVLVGAAHLVGEQGIVRRLARDGITGERINSSSAIAEPAEATP